ncbi:hypothetical protein HN747_02525 [archaeon]|nr:hypothetical protein [archaeon]
MADNLRGKFHASPGEFVTLRAASPGYQEGDARRTVSGTIVTSGFKKVRLGFEHPGNSPCISGFPKEKSYDLCNFDAYQVLKIDDENWTQ